MKVSNLLTESIVPASGGTHGCSTLSGSRKAPNPRLAQHMSHRRRSGGQTCSSSASKPAMLTAVSVPEAPSRSTPCTPQYQGGEATQSASTSQGTAISEVFSNPRITTRCEVQPSCVLLVGIPHQHSMVDKVVWVPALVVTLPKHAGMKMLRPNDTDEKPELRLRESRATS